MNEAALRRSGRVIGLSSGELSLTLPAARLGELLRVEDGLYEVTRIREGEVQALPLEAGDAPMVGADAQALGHTLCVTVPRRPGVVLDGLARPFGQPGPLPATGYPADGPVPSPLRRVLPRRAMRSGIRVIDGLCTLAEGQRMGLFAGPGMGKTTLLSDLARHSEVDAFVVALIGERGWELRAMLEEGLGKEGLARGYVLCAQAADPPLARVRCAQSATALAECLAQQGQRVLLLVDSLSRVARAARQVALLQGQAPVRRGYPPSVFNLLATLIERAGAFPRGAITALYTVLVEGSDFDEPIADEARALLDGHLVLSRERFEAGFLPAIDPLASLSRQMRYVADASHQEQAKRLRSLYARYLRDRDAVMLGHYRPGEDLELDQALALEGPLRRWLIQDRNDFSSLETTLRGLTTLCPAP